MKKEKSHSLYRDLLCRIIAFLVVPFFTVIIFFCVGIKKDFDKSYRTNVQLYIDSGRSVRSAHIHNVYSIANNISANTTLNSFFAVDYTKENLKYYTAQIANIITSDKADDFGYAIYLFYTNDTIPRGLNAFYHLNDLREGRAVDFLDSDTAELWIMPCDTEGYTGAFTPYKNHYTYMRKVFMGDRLLYVLCIFIPQRTMNSFLNPDIGESDILFSESDVTEFNHMFVVNYDASRTFDKSTEEKIESDLRMAKETGADVEYVEISGLPQKLVYVFPANNQSLRVGIIIASLIIFAGVLVGIVLRFTNQVFKKMYVCLSEFDHSIASGFQHKLVVKGADEIAHMAMAFNALIAKIQNLLQITAEQAVVVKDSQLKALQQQINPHFLYNTLEIFSYKMELYHHYEESEAMIAFSNMLRYNTASGKEYASLEMELEQVENYLQIQALKRPDIMFEADIPIELYDLQLPRFLIQPIVENCYSHGYCGKPMNISLRAEDIGEYVLFEVSDNGRGLSSEELTIIENELEKHIEKNQLGIGLSNINSRLCLFYTEDCGLRLISELDKGTKVTWQVPKIMYVPKRGELQ